jgi:hypothetical protein
MSLTAAFNSELQDPNGYDATNDTLPMLPLSKYTTFRAYPNKHAMLRTGSC